MRPRAALRAKSCVRLASSGGGAYCTKRRAAAARCTLKRIANSRAQCGVATAGPCVTTGAPRAQLQCAPGSSGSGVYCTGARAATVRCFLKRIINSRMQGGTGRQHGGVYDHSSSGRTSLRAPGPSASGVYYTGARVAAVRCFPKRIINSRVQGGMATAATCDYRNSARATPVHAWLLAQWCLLHGSTGRRGPMLP